MSTIPPWIERRIDRSLDKTLTQRHVVEVMLDAERPYFSAEQIRARARPDVSKETVRLRLNELRELDVVVADTYPESITLYYVNHPESHWPLSPEGKAALAGERPLDTLSAGEFVRLRNPAGIRTLVLAGFQLTLVLFAIGIAASLLASALPPVPDTTAFVDAAATLFAVCLALMTAERLARAIRTRRATRGGVRTEIRQGNLTD
ncbi:hypothetical protein [Halovivax cerinus]|uniref:Transcriptional regulator n=1 Tax=Halovivax cerinus TaxID=1487865 RepID=A0ABD5NRT7_9EURY|nr:hypothetical protein [Halovivax cerinus]